MTRVVDTSVVIKWIVAEEYSDAALRWARLPLLAPDILRVELANALWKKVRRSEIAPGQALCGVTEAPKAIGFVSTQPLVEPALEIALRLGHPVYDCVFLALADSTGLPLLTADRRLRNACAGSSFESLLQWFQEVPE